VFVTLGRKLNVRISRRRYLRVGSKSVALKWCKVATEREPVRFAEVAQGGRLDAGVQVNPVAEVHVHEVAGSEMKISYVTFGTIGLMSSNDFEPLDDVGSIFIQADFPV